MSEIKHINKITMTEYKGYTIRIEQDTDPLNPRTDWEPAGTMICFHRRYELGDKHNYDTEEANDLIKKVHKEGGVVLNLYLYDHSGISISARSFVGRAQHAEWDSGPVGWIYMDRETILKEYGGKRVSKKKRERVEALLQAEVKTYDKYLRGDVYGFIIEKDGEEVDSCWGFFEDPESIIETECKPIIDNLYESKN